MKKNSNIKKLFDDYPNMISMPITMEKSNANITIYKGIFKLKDKETLIKIQGEVYYNWLPDTSVLFKGEIIEANININEMFNKNITFELILNDMKFGKSFLISIEFGNYKQSTKVKGIISNNAILGDKSIVVSKVRFAIPNLRSFHGHSIKNVSDNNFSVTKGRILLNDDTYSIKIDKASNFNNLNKELENNGGYLLMYSGELTKNNNQISINEANDYLHSLSNFISFLNGRRTSAIFREGSHEKDIKWIDYTDYYVDPYKKATSWSPKNFIIDFDSIWKKYRNLWKDENDRDFINTAIHWYIEANNNAGRAEGSLILSQTALELIYNWWIIENKKMMVGKDTESINASNKIRLLLSQLNINFLVPDKFQSLQNFIKDEKQINDAPDVIVQIRNSIVHSQIEKRKKLAKIDSKVIYEALQLSIWYIELALLRILDYNDRYINRTSKEFIESKTVEYVPWKT